jgi:coenzyme F420-0:L-glutamate ligase/coenzyme F420-1:gamma-L-glutamate ligase
LENEDILVVAQKIVSKAENRLVELSSISPSMEAIELADKSGKDARLAELILRESNSVLRVRPGTVIVEHRLGFICANAGIDHSNVKCEMNNSEETVLCLPEDPDRTAEAIRDHLEGISGKRIGVLIIDSHGRAWRLGTVGTAIGISGFPGLVDLRGTTDMFGNKLLTTELGAADELAGGASLEMGQAGERTPVVHVRGFPYPFREAVLGELIRPVDTDLFR